MLAVVAALNEEDRLASTLAALREAFPDARVMVADDSSRDATPDIARKEGAELSRTPRRLGKGGNVTLALRLALGHEPEQPLVLLLDADLGASAGRLGPLVESVREGDAGLAVAAFSRRAGGGLGLALGAARRTIHARAGVAPTAPISGQRALAPGLVEHVLPFAPGFGMETAMTIDALRAGYRLEEIELDLEHRATGRTARGFAHRAVQLKDIARVYVSRR